MPSSETCPQGPPSQAAKGRSGPSVRPNSAGNSPDSKGFGERPEETERASSDTRKPSPPVREAEKDSGFSDGSSEYLSHVEQTDSEEAETFGPKAMEGLVGSLAPVYLVRNVLLQQPLGASPAAQFLAWSGQPSLEKAHGSATRILFIQQPLASLKDLLPGQKPMAKETSVPGLAGSPRVAPQLGHSLQAKGRTGRGPTRAGDASAPRHFCMEEAWASPISSRAAKDGWEKLQAELLQPPTVLRAPAQPVVAPSAGADPAEGRTFSKASRSLGRQRRFHNTVEILRKSGLLGIALRTKELLRQNSSTQRELAELREHAQLLCEAIQSNNVQSWVRLQEAVDSSAASWAGRGLGAQAPLGAKPVSLAPLAQP